MRRLTTHAALWMLAACRPTVAPQAPRPAPQPQPATPSPVAPPRATVRDPAVQLASRFTHTCVARKSGAVECWGRNTYGQLGNGKREPSASAVKVRGIADAVQVAVGRDFSCALRRGGKVTCWGNNEDGQLGSGAAAKPGALSLRPIEVRGLRSIKQISLGEYHACALDKGGKVRCWGNASNGQIGSDRQRAFNTPLPITQLGPARSIASGANHVCALEKRGTVRCWGRNTEGQLGDGKSGSRLKPVMVAGLEAAAKLASGSNHSCAVRGNGGVACWGANDGRQLGPRGGSERKQRTPVPVPGLKGVVELAGGASHSCARLKGGRVACWGSNAAGQLGHRSSASTRSEPTPVRGVADAISMGLGTAHTCAVRRGGDVVCWGSGDDGALGPHRLAQSERSRALVTLWLTGQGWSETL